MYEAKDIAIFIINWFQNRGQAITNLRLQKLLYFVQGEYCTKTGNRLIKDDFYAWQLGPVIPQIYSQYSIYSSSPLPIQNSEPTISYSDSVQIEEALIKYMNFTTWELVDISHEQDPWKYNHSIFGDKSIIPFGAIKNYFSGDKK